jgi:hypothetical protein
VYPVERAKVADAIRKDTAVGNRNTQLNAVFMLIERR